MNFQEIVASWCRGCFGKEKATSKIERAYRFVEEALELAQSCGVTQDDVAELASYVYNRKADPVEREIGGVMLTVAALSEAYNLSMEECGDKELTRALANVDKIRAKDAARVEGTPLPGYAINNGYPPFLVRLIDEHRQLEDRHNKLTAFLKDPAKLENLSSLDESLLQQQLLTMASLLTLLGQRIGYAKAKLS